jgi:hypothetical protein
MRYIDLLLAKFPSHQSSVCLWGYLNQIETELANPNWISNFFFFVDFILGKQSRILHCLHLSSHTPSAEGGSHCQVPKQSCSHFQKSGDQEWKTGPGPSLTLLLSVPWHVMSACPGQILCVHTSSDAIHYEQQYPHLLLSQKTMICHQDTETVVATAQTQLAGTSVEHYFIFPSIHLLSANSYREGFRCKLRTLHFLCLFTKKFRNAFPL